MARRATRGSVSASAVGGELYRVPSGSPRGFVFVALWLRFLSHACPVRATGSFHYGCNTKPFASGVVVLIMFGLMPTP
jgi:hypothetical protein